MSWIKHNNTLYNLRAFTEIKIARDCSRVIEMESDGDNVELSFPSPEAALFAFKQISKEIGAEEIV